MPSLLIAAILSLTQAPALPPRPIDPHGPSSDPVENWARCMARAATPLVMGGTSPKRAVRRAERDCETVGEAIAGAMLRSEHAAGRMIDEAEARRMAASLRSDARGMMIRTFEILREGAPR